MTLWQAKMSSKLTAKQLSRKAYKLLKDAGDEGLTLAQLAKKLEIHELECDAWLMNQLCSTTKRIMSFPIMHFMRYRETED